MSREAMKLALEYLEESDNYLGSLDHSKPIAALREALAEAEPTTTESNGGKTGWPPGLLQDDCKGLSKWLSNKPDAKRRVREALDKMAKNERELGIQMQPAQQEFVSPGGGYVPAIPAQQRPIKTFHGGKAWPVQEPAQQEPVCPKCGNNRQVWDNQITGTKTCHRFGCHSEILTPQPAQRKPLTDEEMADFLGDRYHSMTENELEFFRLGEAAHGIKEQK